MAGFIPDTLPPYTSAKPCPHCRELLHWSDMHPPEVHFDTRTGFVSHVDLERFCPACSYVEAGFVNIDKDPVWTEVKRE